MREAGHVELGDPADYALIAEVVVLQVERFEEGQGPVGEYGSSGVVDFAGVHAEAAQVAENSEGLECAIEEAVIVGTIEDQFQAACIGKEVLMSRRCRG